MLSSERLRRSQLACIQREIAPLLRYLHRLHDRMQQVGFPPHDPLLKLVHETRDAAFRLDMQLRELIYQDPASHRQPEQGSPRGETRPEQLAKWDQQNQPR